MGRAPAAVVGHTVLMRILQKSCHTTLFGRAGTTRLLRSYSQFDERYPRAMSFEIVLCVSPLRETERQNHTGCTRRRNADIGAECQLTFRLAEEKAHVVHRLQCTPAPTVAETG